MRLLLLLLLGVSCCSGDPDLRQLLQVWQPHLTVPWRNVTAQCASAMEQYSQALRQRQQWASLMLDATGQASSQYLKGSDYWLGSNSQCEEVNREYLGNETTNSAVYRVIKLEIQVSAPLEAPQLVDHATTLAPRRIKLGVCLPGACGDPEQVRSLLEQMLEAAQEEQRYRDVTVHDVKVLPGEKNVLKNTSTILFILFTSTIVFVVALGTWLDVLHSLKEHHNPPGLLQRLLLAFSLPRNAHKMFNTCPSQEGTLPAIHGLRVVGLAWITLCHISFYFMNFGENPSFRKKMEQDFDYQLITSGYFSVDIFFFISGVLLAYIFLRKESNKKPDSLLQATGKFILIVFYRIIRLTLPYIFCVLITMVSIEYWSKDSPFESTVVDVDVCAKYWWRNFLYINNLFPIANMCASWGWYLATDTQLYTVAAVLLLFYVNGYPRAAVTAGVALLVSSLLTTAGISYSLNYIPGGQDTLAYFDLLQGKPWIRMGPFWVGIFTGWMLNSGSYQFKKRHVAAGWMLCVALSFVNVFVMYWRDWFSVAGAAVYMALSSTVWALCLSWVLLTCASKQAGWLGSILESPWLAPLGRVTYCSYLLNNLVFDWIFLNMEAPIPISKGLGFTLILGFFTLDVGLGAITSLIFEAPVIQLLSLARPIQQYEMKGTADQAVTLDLALDTVHHANL